MAKSCPISTFFIIISVLSHFTSRIGLRPWADALPLERQSLDNASRLRVDPDAIRMASRDFGKLVHLPNPAAVLYPCSIEDIASLVKFSYNLSSPFSIAARGRGHCHSGQAMAPHGVVVEMRSLNDCSRGSGIRVTKNSILGSYADVGGEHSSYGVLKATVKHGLAPVSWTDYLYLTVGGVLSNGGISGQTFRRGPPISNVYEMDVLTGKGELVTCSEDTNSKLFFAVLGGLGQFGIITRARIVLEPAPKRVKWIHMLYHDFSAFSRDQEHLISINGLDYLEGSLFLHNCPPNNWRSSFSPSDYPRISSLISKKGIIYCLEVVKYYDDLTSHTVDEVSDFNSGVFRDILPNINQTTGPIHVYPMIRNKWDDRMSAVTPDEDIFYAIGLLHSSGADDWKPLENQNKEILQFCDKAGIKIKLYLSRYTTKEDWMKHFGPKWKTFEDRKAQFDPKIILSPGQRIFNSI
uniref:cytokinin dehydrogenase n=1 Tax=Vitis vinifera TaxID=29760 RepID=A0A346HVJ2_VITVI|nr:cytokinin dehydrogenase 3-like protein 1 [Vitis vinifera]|eukprot:XP_003632404.1 PREDICTED: cytokinin dehydrogenase 5-like [Vitis vinifera]